MGPFCRDNDGDKKCCVLIGLKLERAVELGGAKPKVVMPSGLAEPGADSDTAFAREDCSHSTCASQGAVCQG